MGVACLVALKHGLSASAPTHGDDGMGSLSSSNTRLMPALWV
jgi:hypothetical protein